MLEAAFKSYFVTDLSKPKMLKYAFSKTSFFVSILYCNLNRLIINDKKRFDFYYKIYEILKKC